MDGPPPDSCCAGHRRPVNFAHVNQPPRSPALSPSSSALALGAGPADAASCDSLATLAFPDASITAAQVVPAGGGRDKDLPEHCRVRPRCDRRPTPTSRSKCGCRPPAGTASCWPSATAAGMGPSTPARSATGLRRGYAVTATDNGHQGDGGPWMQQPREAGGLRPSLGPRDGGQGQGGDVVVLRQRAAPQLLSGLLGRRTAGRDGRAPLPRRLRRHRRRRAGRGHHRPRRVLDVDRPAAAPWRGLAHPRREISRRSTTPPSTPATRWTA